MKNLRTKVKECGTKSKEEELGLEEFENNNPIHQHQHQHQHQRGVVLYICYHRCVTAVSALCLSLE